MYDVVTTALSFLTYSYMTKATNRECPRCETFVPNNAPEGLCPRCLADLNLTTETLPADEEDQPDGSVTNFTDGSGQIGSGRSGRRK
jgi:hypothetical protein